MKLSDLKIGESAYLLQVNGDEAFARRLSEIGSYVVKKFIII